MCKSCIYSATSLEMIRSVHRIKLIIRNVHPENLPGEYIMKVEIFVHWQECVNHVYTQPLPWE